MANNDCDFSQHTYVLDSTQLHTSQYRYVIGVVGVGNCCCGVPSASFLRQFEAILSDFVNRCSKYVV